MGIIYVGVTKKPTPFCSHCGKKQTDCTILLEHSLFSFFGGVAALYACEYLLYTIRRLARATLLEDCRTQLACCARSQAGNFEYDPFFLVRA